MSEKPTTAAAGEMLGFGGEGSLQAMTAPATGYRASASEPLVDQSPARSLPRDSSDSAEFLTDIIRVFPFGTKWTPTDSMAYIGEPGLWRPGSKKTPVRISVTFTWHRREAERIAEHWRQYYDDVQIGGPAYDNLAGEFTPGMFLKEGCTITSRGCPKKCAWCAVPKREGAVRELKIKPGWIVQDNNLLACSEKHIRAVFDMLREQHRNIFFNGGLDKHFLQPWHRELFDSIPVGELWFACDIAADIRWLERAAGILEGYPIRKLRCYTMIGYDGENILDAETRLEKVLQLGFLPFTQLYQPDVRKIYPDEWRRLCRKWARPAAMLAVKKNSADAAPAWGGERSRDNGAGELPGAKT